MPINCGGSLVILMVSLNSFMITIPESSLYTILPKYLVDQIGNDTVKGSVNGTINGTVSETANSRVNISKYCHIQKPPYFIVSMVFLAKNLAQVISNLIIGCIVDKVNNFVILIIAQCFGIVVALIYAFGNSVTAYLFGRVLDAFVNSSLFICVMAIISTLFTNINTRGRYFGLGNILYFFSHSIGAVYGAEIDARLGKSAVFFLLIPLWIATILVTACLYKQVSSDSKNQVKDQDEVIKSKNNEIIEINNLKKENIEEIPKIVKQNNTESDLNHKKVKRDIGPFIAIINMLKARLVLICLIELFVVNFSMFALPATLPSWMGFRLCSTEVQQGFVWAFGFIGYIVGVGLVLYAPKYRFYTPIIAQIIVGILLILLPFSHDWRLLFIPIIAMYFCVGIVEQVIFPLTTFLADQYFNSDYGTMSSLTSQSMTICRVIGTLSSGPIAERFGFRILSIALGILNLTFCGLYFFLRNFNKL